jgi:hypothetical protein
VWQFIRKVAVRSEVDKDDEIKEFGEDEGDDENTNFVTLEDVDESTSHLENTDDGETPQQKKKPGILEALSDSVRLFSPIARAEQLKLEKEETTERLKASLRDMDMGLEDVIDSTKETQDFLVKQAIEEKKKNNPVTDEAESQNDNTEDKTPKKHVGATDDEPNKGGVFDVIAETSSKFRSILSVGNQNLDSKREETDEVAEGSNEPDKTANNGGDTDKQEEGLPIDPRARTTLI